MTTQIPVQTIIDPKTDTGLSSYNTTISKVPTNAANVFVTSVTNNTTQINTQVFQTQTNANAAAGASTQVQFNDRSILAGSPGFTFNTNTTTLTVTGNIITGTIRTNNLQWQNGDPMMFSYSNANVTAFLPSYGGNIGATQVTATNFVGNGALLSNLTGAQVNGFVPSANFATESTRANVVVASAQPNITSVGTLVSLNVGGNLLANNISATNSIFANRIAGDGGNISNITGAFVTGVVANASYATLSGTANTISVNAQPNITSVGILTSLQVAGNLITSNATLGNMVYGNYFQGNGSMLDSITGANVTGVVPLAEEANLAVAVSASNQPNIRSVGSLTSLTVTGTITGSNVNFDTVNAQFLVGDGGNITDIPATEIVGTVANATHALVADVANTVAGANVTGTVANATHAAVAAIANTVAGANVTGVVANATHAMFADSASTVAGANVTGTVANASHAISSDSANSVAGANVTGQVSNAEVAGTVYTNAQPNITSVGTLTSLAVAGNITAGNVTITGALAANSVAGDATNLSNIPAGNINGVVANATHATEASIVTGNAQTNITSLGILTSLDVLTHANVGHLVSNGNVSGNVFTANLFNGSGASLTNVNAANIIGTVANAAYANSANTANSALNADVVTNTSQPNITSVGNLLFVNVNGVSNLNNIGNVKIAGGNSGQAIITDGNGNLSFSSVATPSYVDTQISNIIGSAPNALNTLNELANALANDESYSTTITNALATKLDSSAFNITANTWLTTQSTTNVTEGTNLYYTIDRANTAIDNRVTKTFVDNLAVVANIANTTNSVAGANVSGQVANALVAGTVYTNAQPSITSLGTLTGLTVSGEANLNGTTNLGPIANVKIQGGSNTNILSTDGAGNLSWVTKPNLTGYATETYVTSQGYITSASLTYSNISGTPTIGNVAAANFDGSASNVLYGNGVFAAVTGGGGISLTSLSVSSTTASGGGSLTYDNTTGAFTFAPASIPSLTGYATESYVTSQNYITSSALTGYATESYVTSQNYITSTALTGYATETYVTNSLTWANISGKWVTAPVSNTSSGTAGHMAYDAGGNLYVCVAQDTWSKISGTTSW